MYSFSGKLRYSECDAEGRMTFLSMINYLQDASTFQCEELGIGVEFMRSRNKAWFLAAWNIFVPELPSFRDDLVISTWPYQFKGIYGMRNFTITSPDGKPYVQADSLWFLMDYKLGRPVRPMPEEVDALNSVCEPRMEGLPPMERKLELPADALQAPAGQQGQSGFVTAADPVTVQQHHLDTNYHVNNAQYIAIARDAAEWEEKFSRLDAQYKKSAHLGDVIYPFVYRTENGCITDLRDAAGESYAIIRITG